MSEACTATSSSRFAISTEKTPKMRCPLPMACGAHDSAASKRVVRLPSPDTPGVRPLSLRRNFTWTLAGNIVYAASQWGILVILAKLGTAAMLGQYALAVAVSAPIIIFFQFHLRALQVTDAKDEYLFAHYFGHRIVGMIIATAVAAAIGLVAYPPMIGLLILMVAVNQAVAACRDLFFGAMQKQERMDVVGVGQMISGVLNLAFLGGAIALTGSLHVAIAMAILSKLGMWFFYDRPQASKLLKAAAGEDAAAASMRPSFTGAQMWRLAKLAAPLGLVMMIISACTSIPRYFIEAFHGQAALGYFAAIAALLQAGRLIIAALGQSALPRLARYYEHNLRAYRLLVFKLLACGVVVGLGGVAVAHLIGGPILTLLFTAEYAAYQDVFVLVMIGGGVLYVASFLGVAMTAARYLKIQVPINILILLVTLFGSWWLVEPHGLWGAAMTLLIAAGVRIIAHAAVVVYAAGRGAALRVSA